MTGAGSLRLIQPFAGDLPRARFGAFGVPLIAVRARRELSELWREPGPAHSRRFSFLMKTKSAAASAVKGEEKDERIESFSELRFSAVFEGRLWVGVEREGWRPELSSRRPDRFDPLGAVWPALRRARRGFDQACLMRAP